MKAGAEEKRHRVKNGASRISMDIRFSARYLRVWSVAWPGKRSQGGMPFRAIGRFMRSARGWPTMFQRARLGYIPVPMKRTLIILGGLLCGCITARPGPVATAVPEERATPGYWYEQPAAAGVVHD